jgi:hypothetical protein
MVSGFSTCYLQQFLRATSVEDILAMDPIGVMMDAIDGYKISFDPVELGVTFTTVVDTDTDEDSDADSIPDLESLSDSDDGPTDPIVPTVPRPSDAELFDDVDDGSETESMSDGDVPPLASSFGSLGLTVQIGGHSTFRAFTDDDYVVVYPQDPTDFVDDPIHSHSDSDDDLPSEV